MPPPGIAHYRWLDDALNDIRSVASKYPKEVIIVKLQEDDSFKLRNYDDMYGMVNDKLGEFMINASQIPITSNYSKIVDSNKRNIYVRFNSPECKNPEMPACRMSLGAPYFDDSAYLGSQFQSYSSDTVPALLRLTQKAAAIPPSKLLVTQFVNQSPDPKGQVTITNQHVDTMINALFSNNLRDIILLNFMSTADDASAGFGCTASNKIINANLLPAGSWISSCIIESISPIAANFSVACKTSNGLEYRSDVLFPPPNSDCSNINGQIQCKNK